MLHRSLSLDSSALPTVAPLSEDEFASAFTKGYVLTVRFLFSQGAKPDVAEEVSQAAWAKGWEHRFQVQRPEMFGAWVNSIAKNMLRHRVRSDQRMEVLPHALSATESSTGVWVDADRVLSQYKHPNRTILCRYYIDGYTASEIARQIGLTPVAVRVRLLRMRRAIRANFQLTADCKPDADMSAM